VGSATASQSPADASKLVRSAGQGSTPASSNGARASGPSD
jgi:hypothetical protein